MDSLSQIVLGSSVAAAVTPVAHRRAALVVGAVLGTLPDLDSFPLMLAGLDPVSTMTWHRGPSHSLFVLVVFGWLLWLVLKHAWAPVRETPHPWFWAIQLALLTHPLLDAFTIYGTQLWWPIPSRPVMGGSMFIIDPLYTLPLIAGCFIAWRRPMGRLAQRGLLAGVIASSAYLGWSLFAQAWVDRIADRELAAVGLENAPRFVSPSPLNTLLWRIIVMTPDGYREGFHSLAVDRKPIHFKNYSSDTAALAAVADTPAARRLVWFNHGFMKSESRDGRLILSDLRMGSEPDYVFRFVVAESDGRQGWRPITPENAEWPNERGRAAGTWTRLWREP